MTDAAHTHQITGQLEGSGAQAGTADTVHAATIADAATDVAEPEIVQCPFVTTVHRPGLPDVHLGFAFPHQAEHASWSLTDDLRNTQHVAGTTITWSPTFEGVSVLAPVPAHAYALADLIAQEDNNLPMGHAFPDLFSRLKAQEGYDAAARIWRDACTWLDRNESENESEED